jgi:hypothetical protein
VKIIIFDQNSAILKKPAKKFKYDKSSWIQVVLDENINISPNEHDIYET